MRRGLKFRKSVTVDSLVESTGALRDPVDYRDWPVHRLVGGIPSGLLSSVDFRAQCSPVKNQGKVNACTAFAVSGSFELARILSGRDAGFSKVTDASEQLVYWGARTRAGFEGKHWPRTLRFVHAVQVGKLVEDLCVAMGFFARKLDVINEGNWRFWWEKQVSTWQAAFVRGLKGEVE